MPRACESSGLAWATRWSARIPLYVSQASADRSIDPVVQAASAVATFPALSASSFFSSTLAVNSTPTSLSPSDQTRQHRMSRHIHPIPELWREWHEGIGGGPLIFGLNAEHVLAGETVTLRGRGTVG